MDMYKRNWKIIHALEDYNMTEVAKKFNISRQRVNQIADEWERKYNIKVNRSHCGHLSRVISKDPTLGTMQDTDIAELYGVPSSRVNVIRNRVGVEVYKRPIGCPKCKTKPYARDLCKACYGRALRVKDYSFPPKKKPGRKSK